MAAEPNHGRLPLRRRVVPLTLLRGPPATFEQQSQEPRSTATAAMGRCAKQNMDGGLLEV